MKKDLLFLIVLGIIFSVIIPIFRPGGGQGDFLAYWSAAHLLVHGSNPFSESEMGILQKTISPERFTSNEPIIAWNPPWLITILLPIGLLPFSYAVPIWIFCNTLLIGLAVITTWRWCIGEKNSKGIFWVYLTCFLFVETIVYLESGQITAFVLMGIVLVIWCLNRNMDIQAGLALLLTTIKPHISYFFIILILFFVISNHRWKVIVGSIAGALFSMLVLSIIHPSWLNDYLALVSSLPYKYIWTSTLGSFMSAQFNISIFKYSAILLIFLIRPLMKLISKEGLLTTINMALLASIPISPYGFNFDQIVLLPSLVQIVSWLLFPQFPRKSVIIIASLLIIGNFFLLKLALVKGLEQYWFFWVPFAILAIYLYARQKRYEIT